MKTACIIWFLGVVVVLCVSIVIYIWVSRMDRLFKEFAESRKMFDVGDQITSPERGEYLVLDIGINYKSIKPFYHVVNENGISTYFQECDLIEDRFEKVGENSFVKNRHKRNNK